jgi:hypothetical protein
MKNDETVLHLTVSNSNNVPIWIHSATERVLNCDIPDNKKSGQLLYMGPNTVGVAHPPYLKVQTDTVFETL